MFVKKLIKAFDAGKLDYALVGGYAVVAHGAIRGTVDIDIILKNTKKDFILAEKILKKLGLVSKLPVSAAEVFEFRREYIKNRNLIAWSFVNADNPIEMVDIIITHDLRKMKKKLIPLGGIKVKILDIQDLIKMKSSTRRKQDKEDVKALKKIRDLK